MIFLILFAFLLVIWLLPPVFIFLILSKRGPGETDIGIGRKIARFVVYMSALLGCLQLVFYVHPGLNFLINTLIVIAMPVPIFKVVKRLIK